MKNILSRSPILRLRSLGLSVTRSVVEPFSDPVAVSSGPSPPGLAATNPWLVPELPGRVLDGLSSLIDFDRNTFLDRFNVSLVRVPVDNSENGVQHTIDIRYCASLEESHTQCG